MKQINVKVKDIIAELDKLSNNEIKQFLNDSKLPHKVPEDSIVREVVSKIYGEYTISRMIIIKSYIADVILGRKLDE